MRLPQVIGVEAKISDIVTYGIFILFNEKYRHRFPIQSKRNVTTNARILHAVGHCSSLFRQNSKDMKASPGLRITISSANVGIISSLSSIIASLGDTRSNRMVLECKTVVFQLERSTVYTGFQDIIYVCRWNCSNIIQ